jgi:peroxiredoxin
MYRHRPPRRPVAWSALSLRVRPLRVLTLTALLLVAAAAHAVEVGEPAPQFSGRSLEGNQLRSLAAYKGKVVYLDFWASWCGPCVVSLPALESLRKEIATDQFQVLAVNVDKDPAVARKFLERHPIGFPSVSDPEGRIPQMFKVPTMPTSYLIDRRGRVRHVHTGFRPSDIPALRAVIRALLAERP